MWLTYSFHRSHSEVRALLYFRCYLACSGLGTLRWRTQEQMEPCWLRSACFLASFCYLPSLAARAFCSVFACASENDHNVTQNNRKHTTSPNFLTIQRIACCIWSRPIRCSSALLCNCCFSSRKAISACFCPACCATLL